MHACMYAEWEVVVVVDVCLSLWSKIFFLFPMATWNCILRAFCSGCFCGSLFGWEGLAGKIGKCNMQQERKSYSKFHCHKKVGQMFCGSLSLLGLARVRRSLRARWASVPPTWGYRLPRVKLGTESAICTSMSQRAWPMVPARLEPWTHFLQAPLPGPVGRPFPWALYKGNLYTSIHG